MKNIDSRQNITFALCLAMVAVIILLSIHASTRSSQFSYVLIDEKLTSNVNSFNLRLEEFENNSRAAAVSLAARPDAIKAIRDQDRDEIRRIFTETYDLYRVNFYTITDAEGTVLVRTHEPERHGDSIVNQHNIANALNGEVSSYFEAGTVVRVSVRTGTPVYDDDGTLIGTISSGVRLDTDEAVDDLKRLIGADISVFYGDERIATTIMDNGIRATGTTLDPEIAEALQEGEGYFGEINLFGAWYKTYYKPFHNDAGDVFAIIFLGVPVDELRSQSTVLIVEVSLIAVMCVALSVILLSALRQMTAANKAKSAFLSTMSHEIRTPMNAILGITEILLQNSEVRSDVRTSIEKIHASGDLLLGIINDILDLSKIEAGKLDIIPVEYETASLISDTSQLNMMRIGSKPIEFELRVDPNLPVKVCGDELRVKQILNNLLSNAFKYTKQGKVALSVSLQVQESDAGEQGLEDMDGWTMTSESFGTNSEKQATVTLIFSISDTGQGMNEAQLAKLGSEYARFNLTANRTTEGTGLGMSITKNLIEMMNGSMTVESEPGKGSTFTVYLPQGKIGDEALGKEMVNNLHRFRTRSRTQMKRAQITREYMPYGSVMVVDDVETNIFVASGLLAPYGLKMDSAESGFDAIRKLESGKVYDIIFMDHMMPEMDGVETTKRIREMGYTEPIVALTANAISGQAEFFLSCGFDDFISKPIDMRQLNTVLNRLVRDKQPPEVLEAARSEACKDYKTAGKECPYVSEDGGDGSAAAADFDPSALSPKIIEAFLRDADKSIDVLCPIVRKGGDYSEEELRLFTINTHGLKTILAIVGHKELSDAARELETLGRERNIAAIAEKTPPFMLSLKALVEQVKKDTGSGSDGNPDGSGSDMPMSAEDRLFLRKNLQGIVVACGNFDEVAADNFVKELEAKQWPKPVTELLSGISRHLLHSDFDEAAAAAEEYLK